MTATVIVGETVRTRELLIERGARLASGLLAHDAVAGDAVALLMRNDFAKRKLRAQHLAPSAEPDRSET